MASIIKADVWQNTLGTSYQTVLQVKQTFKTDSFGTSSTSWVDVPGLLVSIAPNFATSKILVMVNVPFARTGTGSDAFVRLLRGETPVGNGNWGAFGQAAGQYGLDPVTGSRVFLDSPNTVLTLNYKVQVYTANDAVYVGTRRLNDFILGSDITVMEIAQ